MNILKRLPPCKPAISAFRAKFAPLTLGEYECLELLCPELQKTHTRRDYFDNLRQISPWLLDIYLNKNLGSQNARVSEELLLQYVAKHNLETMLLATSPRWIKPEEAAKLVGNTLGAIWLQSPEVAERIAEKVMGGRGGLAEMYIYSW